MQTTRQIVLQQQLSDSPEHDDNALIVRGMNGDAYGPNLAAGKRHAQKRLDKLVVANDNGRTGHFGERKCWILGHRRESRRIGVDRD